VGQAPPPLALDIPLSPGGTRLSSITITSHAGNIEVYGVSASAATLFRVEQMKYIGTLRGRPVGEMYECVLAETWPDWPGGIREMRLPSGRAARVLLGSFEWWTVVWIPYGQFLRDT